MTLHTVRTTWRRTRLATAEDRDWQEQARCAETDPEAFFPDKGAAAAAAKRICLGCEVRAECLEYALLHGERFGVWGGLSERERRQIAPDAAPEDVADLIEDPTLPVDLLAEFADDVIEDEVPDDVLAELLAS